MAKASVVYRFVLFGTQISFSWFLFAPVFAARFKDNRDAPMLILIVIVSSISLVLIPVIYGFLKIKKSIDEAMAEENVETESMTRVMKSRVKKSRREMEMYENRALNLWWSEHANEFT